MVKVVYFGPLKNITGCHLEEFEYSSFDELKKEIINKYGHEIEKMFDYCAFWKNGDEFDNDSFIDGDEIEILPPVSGG